VDQSPDHVQLVREAWPNQVRVIGKALLEKAATDPAGALAAAGSGGADDALRFDTKTAVEIIVGALTIAKLALETWKAWKSANRAATAAELDKLIRSKVQGQPAEESLLQSKEYAALIAKIATL
jgi:hypothetical protein